MQKYNIEGGIDFFNELYKSLDIDENEYKTEEDNNLCLITNSLLTDKFVEMECGHKFNYIPLYNDIRNHKHKFNNMEGTCSRLNIDEIRCPYCRKKQKGVLPYYEEFGLEKIHGVNIIKLVNTYSTSYNRCEFLTPNLNYDPSGNELIETSESNTGNCKFFKCFHYGYKNNNYTESLSGIFNTILSEKYYCYMHKKQVIRNYKKELTDKAKQEAKLLKIKQKEDIKKVKEEEKQKAKEEKQKAKEELKSLVMNAKLNKKSPIIDVENTVVGIIDISSNVISQYCPVILKSGMNKGNICGCKVIENNVCKRHLKMSLEKNNSEM
jgi:hypothetical protein